MRARILAILTALVVLALAAPAQAGSPHFVGTPVATTVETPEGKALTVTGKIAGLGNEDQVHVVLSATAACVNPGGNKPQAANKQTVSAEGDFPVQNGRAEFSLTLAPVFQPSCSPPMSVQFSGVVVTDETSGISVAIPGVF